jgi:hypothetical protein
MSPAYLDLSHKFLDTDGGNFGSEFMRQKVKQEWHKSTLSFWPAAVKDWTAFIAQQNECAALLQGEQQLTEELVMWRQNTHRIGAYLPMMQSVFSHE